MSEYEKTVLFSSHNIEFTARPLKSDMLEVKVSWSDPEYKNNKFRDFLSVQLLQAYCNQSSLISKWQPFMMEASELLAQLASQGFTFKYQTCEFDIVHPDGCPVEKVWGYHCGWSQRRTALKKLRNAAEKFPINQYSPLRVTLQGFEDKTKKVNTQKVLNFLSQQSIPVDEALYILQSVEELPAGTDHIQVAEKLLG